MVSWFQCAHVGPTLDYYLMGSLRELHSPGFPPVTSAPSYIIAPQFLLSLMLISAHPSTLLPTWAAEPGPFPSLMLGLKPILVLCW